MALVLHMQDPFIKKTWIPRKAWKRSSNAVLGPKSPAKIPITANKGKIGRLKSVAELYAGSSAFAASPPPTSLPIPTFLMKKNSCCCQQRWCLKILRIRYPIVGRYYIWLLTNYVPGNKKLSRSWLSFCFKAKFVFTTLKQVY